MEKEKITVSTVDKLAHLSELFLSVEERESFVGEIASIVEMLDMCGDCNVGSEQEMHCVTLNELREDVVCESMGNLDALKNAPISKKGYLVVPKVVD